MTFTEIPWIRLGLFTSEFLADIVQKVAFVFVLKFRVIKSYQQLRLIQGQ